MPIVSFTSALRRFLDAPPAKVEAGTVGEALAAVFAERPALRGYVLDDQGHLRANVVVFIDGRPRLSPLGGRLLYLNGVHVSSGIQLIRGDVVELGEARLEVG